MKGMDLAQFEARSLSWAEAAIRETAKGTLFEFSDPEEQQRVLGVEWVTDPHFHHKQFEAHEKLIGLEGVVQVTYSSGKDGEKKPVDTFAVTVTVKCVTGHQGRLKVNVHGSMHEYDHPSYRYRVEYITRPTKA